VTSFGRRPFTARSKRLCSGSVELPTASCRIGTLEALYRMMNGGVVPGGICRIAACEIAVTCAVAASIFAFFWKKTLMTPTP
jgi:hypothetical protein